MAPQKGKPLLCFLPEATRIGILVGLSGREVLLVLEVLVSKLFFCRKVSIEVCFVAGLRGVSAKVGPIAWCAVGT